MENKNRNSIIEEQNEGLKREIGTLDVAVNVINSIVGGGIFLIPALIAISLGNASIIAYLLCGAILFTVMLCFAEAGSRITGSGGAYAYIEAAFGPFAGFLANFLFIFGFGLLCDGAIANGMADMLSIHFPVFSQTPYRSLLFFVMFGVFAYINVIGVKQGVKVVRLITFVKLTPLLILILLGLTNLSAENFVWEGWPSASNLGQASLILFFAFQGGETALNLSGEMKNPKRTAPGGILLGIGFVVLFYIAIQLISQGVLGTDLKNHEAAPLAAVAGALIGPIGITLFIGVAVFSIFGTLSGSPLTYPRMIFAGAKDKLLPSLLAKIHPRFATPYWAIITYASLSFIVSSSGGFKQLAIVSSAAMLMIYLGVVLSVIKFRLYKSRFPQSAFKIPGGFAVPVFALLIIAWFLSNLTSGEITGLVIFMAFLALVYGARLFLKRKKQAKQY